MEAQQTQAETPRELIERKSDLVALLKHPGWKAVKDYLERNRNWRQQMIMATAIGDDADGKSWTVERQEYRKGEVAGMFIAEQIPQQIIDRIEEDLEMINQENVE